MMCVLSRNKWMCIRVVWLCGCKDDEANCAAFDCPRNE